MKNTTKDGAGLAPMDCSALDSAWKAINPILRGAMDYEDFKAGWEACAKHIRENESIQIIGCPRCDHEFEAEVTFESLEPNDQEEPRHE